MFLGCIVLQLFCICNLCYMKYMFCTFTLALPEICVQCPVWLCFVVPWYRACPLCFWGILRMTFRRFQETLLLLVSLLFSHYHHRHHHHHHHHHHHCYAGYFQSALDKNWLSILVWIKMERPKRQYLFTVYAHSIYISYCVPDLGARITELQSSYIHREHKW